MLSHMSPLLGPIAAWLGRLSVSRKLTLIYLLDLTAVIFVSGILINEKYLAIDFARKELVGVAYTNAVRDVLMPQVGTPSLAQVDTTAARHRLASQRAHHILLGRAYAPAAHAPPRAASITSSRRSAAISSPPAHFTASAMASNSSANPPDARATG